MKVSAKEATGAREKDVTRRLEDSNSARLRVCEFV
jgi:hypothetical protein